MGLPIGLRWLCGHRWRRTSTPRRFPSWLEREWVCLDCRKRIVRNLTLPPIIRLEPWEPEPGRPDPYDEVLPL